MTDRLEALQELVRQYRQAPDAYVAYMICRDLGLLRRARSAALAEGAAIPGMEEEISAAAALLDERPSVVEEALSMVDGDEMLRRFRQYVRTRPAGDDTDEGLSLLYTYDCLHQLVAVAAGDERKLAEAVRSRVAGLGNALRAMASVVEEHVQAFGAFAPMVNQYCLEWDVEEANPLSRVAEFESREIAELVTADRARVAVVPRATADCLNENLLVEVAERIVPLTLEVERHLAACLRCRELLDNAINTYVRTPLTFWERLARFKGRLTRGGRELVEATQEELQGLLDGLRRNLPGPTLEPAVLHARGAGTLPVQLLDEDGTELDELQGLAVIPGRIVSGRFHLVVQLPDARLTGSRAWVALELPEEELYVMPATVEEDVISVSVPIVRSGDFEVPRFRVAVVAPSRGG